MAPSQHLNRCLLIGEVLWHAPENNFTAKAQATILYDKFKNNTFEVIARILLMGGNKVMA